MLPCLKCSRRRRRRRRCFCWRQVIAPLMYGHLRCQIREEPVSDRQKVLRRLRDPGGEGPEEDKCGGGARSKKPAECPGSSPGPKLPHVSVADCCPGRHTYPFELVKPVWLMRV